MQPMWGTSRPSGTCCKKRATGGEHPCRGWKQDRPVGLQEAGIGGLDCRLRLTLREYIDFRGQKEELLVARYCGQGSLGPSLAL